MEGGVAPRADGVRWQRTLQRTRTRYARAVTHLRRRFFPSDDLELFATLVFAATLTFLHVAFRGTIPLAGLTLPLFLGGYLLGVRNLSLLLLGVALLVAFARWRDGSTSVFPGVLVLLFATSLLALSIARSRARIGVQGNRGDTLLVDIRDRLGALGRLPALPAGWHAEATTRSAQDSAFSGDFVVASRSEDGAALQVALVDVSGKGLDAGSRSLLLSGAFSALLGAVPSEEFLPAANSHLLRQQWAEGFATAVHVALDLRTGDYVVSSAGHPPAAQFVAASGHWRTREVAKGPLLGVIDGAAFEGERGRLRHGDALLLYSDGLVELPGRDLAVGIDRLLGEAERLVPVGFAGGTGPLIQAVAGDTDDDRALVLIWRD